MADSKAEEKKPEPLSKEELKAILALLSSGIWQMSMKEAVRIDQLIGRLGDLVK